MILTLPLIKTLPHKSLPLTMFTQSLHLDPFCVHFFSNFYLLYVIITVYLPHLFVSRRWVNQ